MGSIASKILFFLLTIGVYYLIYKVQKKTGWIWLNPILITMAVIIALLKTTGTSYNNYMESGKWLNLWFHPAVVALGVPLYKQFANIRKQLIPIMLCQIGGCITGIISVVLIAQCLGASKVVVVSLSAKSVTTPIAMSICESMGGIPSLTAAIVICTGILGTIISMGCYRIFAVRNPISQGIGIGTASHAIGTAQAMQISQRYGVYSSLGLILNGILTAMFTPPILMLMGII